MFDTLLGLPLHPLVIHAVVIVGPMAALTAIAYAVRPSLRPALVWWLAGFAVVTGISSFVAGESGEALEHRLEESGMTRDSALGQLVHEHAEAGDVMKVVGILFMLLVLVAIFWVLPPREGGRGANLPGWLRTAAVVVLVLVSIYVIVQVVITGHTGAEAVWSLPG